MDKRVQGSYSTRNVSQKTKKIWGTCLKENLIFTLESFSTLHSKSGLFWHESGMKVGRHTFGISHNSHQYLWLYKCTTLVSIHNLKPETRRSMNPLFKMTLTKKKKDDINLNLCVWVVFRQKTQSLTLSNVNTNFSALIWGSCRPQII